MVFPLTGYDPRYGQDIWGRQGIDQYGRLPAYGLPGGEQGAAAVPPLAAPGIAPAGQSPSRPVLPPSIMGGDGRNRERPVAQPFDWDAKFNPMRDIAGMQAPDFSWGDALKESLGFGTGGGTTGGGLMGMFGDLGGDDPYARAQQADIAQKGLNLGGMFGASVLAPVGMAAGEYARQVANEAYAPYGEIGFMEDIMQPDIMYGSPEDILSELRAGQDVAISGGLLGKDEKAGLVDYYNAKGIKNEDGNDVKASDLTDQGAIKGSAQERMLEAQMAGFGPEYGVTPTTAQYTSPEAANMAIAGLLSSPPANVLGGQQVSQAERDVSAQAEIQRQAKAAQAAAQADAIARGAAYGGVGPGTGTGGWASGSYGTASDYGFDRDRDTGGGYGTDVAGSAGGA